MIERDMKLLEELRSNNESALRKLFDLYYIPLCLYSYQITDSFEQSEDIVQDFFISFWEKKLYNKISINLRSYLFQSVRNMSLTAIAKRDQNIIEEFEEASYSPIEDKYDNDELQMKRDLLYAELKSLSKQEYNVLTAIVFDNKRYKEVASDLEISVNTVKTHLSRALKHLRKKELLSILISII